MSSDLVRRGVLVLGLVALNLVGGVPGAVADTDRWRVAAVVEESSEMRAVVVTGRRDAWAFGGSRSTNTPVARRWNGRSWSAVKLPPGLQSIVPVADASGPRNVWAFGGFGSDPYALRWNGRRWSVARPWASGSVITDAVVLGPRDVWVFGDDPFGLGVGTWHLAGGRWQEIQQPPGVSMSLASAVSATDIWAVGRTLDQSFSDAVARWDGQAWTRVPVPVVPQDPEHYARFRGIHANSATDVWVAGSIFRVESGITVQEPLMLHYDGTGWRRVEVPAADPVQLMRVRPDGSGGLWVTTFDQQPPGGGYVLRFRAGRWSRVPLPAKDIPTMWDVAAVPGTSRFWGVGMVRPPAPELQGIILKYAD